MLCLVDADWPLNVGIIEMEAALQEAQEEAVQAAFSVYNSEAVGNGPVRRNYEKQLHATLRRQFEVHSHDQNGSIVQCLCIFRSTFRSF